MTDLSDWLNDVHVGDAQETLRDMPENTVHMAMCSPPYYGLRDYDMEGQIGLEDTLNEYIQNLVDVGRELRRVLRDDGSWWLNLGDSFAGSWGAQSMDAEDNDIPQPGHPDKNPARNGVMKRKNKMLVPYRVAIALQEDGWIVRNDVTWVKPNPMPSSVKDRLNTTTERVFHLVPEPSYWYDLDAIREPHKESSIKRDSYAYDGDPMGGRYEMPDEDRDGTPDESFLNPKGKNPGDVFRISTEPYPDAHFAVYPPELCRKPIKATCPPKVCVNCGTPYERETEQEILNQRNPEKGDRSKGEAYDGTSYGPDAGLRDGFKEKRINTKGWTKECDCGTQETEAGIALDPFAGAGTTCLVAKELGRRFIGIDLNPDYVAMAQARIGITVDDPDRLTPENQATLDELSEDAGD